MQTTVTTKNVITIPAGLSRKMGITPGCRIEWGEPKEGSDEVLVRVIPQRAELAKRLLGSGRKWSPGRDAVRELNEERVREDGQDGGK